VFDAVGISEEIVWFIIYLLREKEKEDLTEGKNKRSPEIQA